MSKMENLDLLNDQSGIIGDLNGIMGFEPNMALRISDLRARRGKKRRNDKKCIGQTRPYT